ncbi:MAG: hypothetical protein HYY93_10665 [Planctomycetes bacterium]|nr:hypothetical protein [Planctomycetota bacterium]
MRPELSERICGRCGKACDGYDEFAPMHDPPRRCAACAIDARFWARWVPRTLAILSGLALAGLLYVTVFTAVALTSQAWQQSTGLSALGWLVMAMVGFGDLLVFWAGWRFFVRASHEGARVREILEQDRRLQRIRGQETAPASCPADRGAGASATRKADACPRPNAADSATDPRQAPGRPQEAALRDASARRGLKVLTLLLGLAVAGMGVGTAVAAALALWPPWDAGERRVVAGSATLLAGLVILQEALAAYLIRRTRGDGARSDSSEETNIGGGADLDRILSAPHEAPPG